MPKSADRVQARAVADSLDLKLTKNPMKAATQHDPAQGIAVALHTVDATAAVNSLVHEWVLNEAVVGPRITEAQVQAWADEAEAGYDVDQLQKRWGRPPRAETTSQVVVTRFSEAELAELMARAQCEGMDSSAAIRAAVGQWAHA